jgi:hypothetical protein
MPIRHPNGDLAVAERPTPLPAPKGAANCAPTAVFWTMQTYLLRGGAVSSVRACGLLREGERP